MLNSLKRIPFDFVANYIAPAFWIPGSMRKKLYQLAGVNVLTTEIKKNCYIQSNKVNIGKNTFINSHSKLYSAYYDGGEITIGNFCYIGMNTLFCTITHELWDETCRAGKGQYFPIVVEDGCWIGANVTVLPGVTIGKGCVIAAGAVVTKDCEPNGLYAGVPAKRVKELPVGEEARLRNKELYRLGEV